MKQGKRFLKSNIRRLLSLLLVMTLLLPPATIVSFAADNDIVDVEMAYTGTLMENVDGYWSTNSETGEDYFVYSLDDSDLEITLHYADGSAFTGDGTDIYNETDEWVYTWCNDDTVWNVGMHQAAWEYDDFSGTVDVEVVDGPVESVSINYTKVLYNEIDGGWRTDWDSGQKYFEYYLDSSAMDITVTYKDGTVYTGDQYDIEWQTGISFLFDEHQSVSTPWTVGKNTVDFRCANYTGSFEVEVVENPVQAVDVNCTKQFRELYDGKWGEDYGEYGESYEFFDYMPSKSDLAATITYKDGTTYTGSVADVEEQTGMTFSVDWNNRYNNPWKVGDNTAEFTFAGISGTFNVKVLESPVSSIEIVKARTLRENENMDYGYVSGTAYSRYEYDFTYRLHFTDGTSQLFSSNKAERNVKITDTQATGPWSVDGKNEFTITCGGVSATGSVKILPSENAESDFDFIAQDGGIVITGYNGSSANLDVPSEINGQPVIGIQSLGGNDAVTDVTVPDSVKFLGNQWAKNLGNIETVHLGKNVSNFDPDMFFEGYDESEPSIKSVTVSGENPYFMDIDGVVYTKDGTTLVFYPYGHGNNYTVPDGVTNIDLLFDSNYSYNYRDVNVIANTENFISEAGVLYTKGKQKILKCSTDKAGQYIMPESVTEILANAFENCTKLTSVQVSSNVTEIPDFAFNDCISLQTVTMPSVVSVGEYAFYYCRNLTQISAKPFTSLGSSCFSSCESLQAVALGEGLQSIPSGAFSHCSALESIEIPDSVTYIGDAAFEYCTSLTEIIVPSGVTEMCDWTFSQCEQLKHVEIQGSIGYLGENTFAGCIALSDIELPNSIQSIDPSVGFADTAYYNDYSNWYNGALYLDNYLITVNDGDINFASNYEVAPGTQVIAGGAFKDCTNITSVVIPGSVVSIGYGAFENCSKLASVSLADGITSISDFAFAGCENLKEISIPDSVVELAGFVFDGCTALTNVKMSSAIKELDYRVFADCPNLKLDFLDGIETIGWYAFSGSALTTDTLVIPDSVTSIVYDAFEGNTSISNIEVPDHFVSIQQGAFDDTAWYTSQSDGPLYLGSLLYTCKGSFEQSVEVASGTKWIASGAFEEQPIDSISLPEGLQQIGENAFLNCFMDEIYIPESVTEIQERALGYYGYLYVDGYLGIPGFTIYGYAGTEAERYANDNGFKFVALSKPTDTETGISVVPAYADGSLPENAVLTVETLSSSPMRVCYDIALTADGQTVQPDSAVAVKIPVPAGMDGAACKVYRAEADGTYTDMKAAYADGYLIFTTDHFSEYVVTTGDPDVPSVTLGDVDGNGTINAADAVMVLRSDAGLITLTAEQAAAADVNGDGVVNAADAVQILRFDAGLLTQF